MSKIKDEMSMRAKGGKGKMVQVGNVPLPVKMVHEKMDRPKPHIHLTEKDLPAIKNWKVGQVYTAIIQFKMMSSNLGNDHDMPMSESGGDKKKMMSSGFEIQKITTKDGKKDYDEMARNTKDL